MSKHAQFLEYISGDETRIVKIEELKEKGLAFGNGGSWCRMDGTFAKTHNYVTRKGNGVLTYSWEPTDEERKQAELDFSVLESGRANTLTHIKVYGKKETPVGGTKSIRSDIKDFFKGKECVVCGNKHTEVDHKNGLYNNPRVLTLETQTLEDFQPLCRHCNQQKRTSILEMKKTGIRHKATRIPSLAPLQTDYIQGDESYSPSNPDAMVGTYWYDPVAFHRAFSKNRYRSFINEDGEEEFVKVK